MTPCTVYACEAQPILVAGLQSVLEQTEDFRLVGAASTTAGALEDIPVMRPRVVVLDLDAGWGEVHQFMADLKSTSPESEAILWAEDVTSTDCYRAMQVGARGVFRRTLPLASLLACLREVAAGRVWLEAGIDAVWEERPRALPGVRLTPRERDIVQLVARGLRNREIAERLSITTGTVKVHLMHVFEKASVKDRYELALQARALLGENARDRG